MADFVANKITDEIYPWLVNTKMASTGFPTHAQLAAKISQVIEDMRQQQPNELRPRASLPCFVLHLDTPEGQHVWYAPLKADTEADRLERCICGAVRAPKGSYLG